MSHFKVVCVTSLPIAWGFSSTVSRTHWQRLDNVLSVLTSLLIDQITWTHNREVNSNDDFARRLHRLRIVHNPSPVRPPCGHFKMPFLCPKSIKLWRGWRRPSPIPTIKVLHHALEVVFHSSLAYPPKGNEQRAKRCRTARRIWKVRWGVLRNFRMECP